MNNGSMLTKCQGLALRTALPRFQAKHPGLYLLGRISKNDIVDKPGFFTGVVSVEELDKRQQSNDTTQENDFTRIPFLVKVKKDLKNNWKDWIGIGRSSNNDVPLRYLSVSKFHAWIQTEELGGEGLDAAFSYSITDADSTNGTWLNGALLVPSKPYKLQSGDKLIFGDVECQFLDSVNLYDTLRSIPKIR